jgi:glucuronate isomerase
MLSKVSARVVGREARAGLQRGWGSTDEWFVKPATRLDVVVKLRERDEERTRTVLADSERAAKQAAEQAAAAQLRARQDGRKAGSAADWMLLDAAHGRARQEAATAEQAAGAADAQLAASREQYSSAYQRAETIRRVADARRAEMIAEAEMRERKELDEIAVVRHATRRG